MGVCGIRSVSARHVSALSELGIDIRYRVIPSEIQAPSHMHLQAKHVTEETALLFAGPHLG